MTNDEEILACEAELVIAQLTSDVESLDRLIDDSLVFTGLDGALVTKQEDLSFHRSGRIRITKMEPTDRRILQLGETAVVSVRMNAEAVTEDTPVAAILRYTRVWHKQPDGWRVVAGHMSPVT